MQTKKKQLCYKYLNKIANKQNKKAHALDPSSPVCKKKKIFKTPHTKKKLYPYWDKIPKQIICTTVYTTKYLYVVGWLIKIFWLKVYDDFSSTPSSEYMEFFT